MRGYDNWKLAAPPWYDKPDATEEKCDNCDGEGWIEDENGSEHMCKYCRGTGKVLVD